MASASGCHCIICRDWISIADKNVGKECTQCKNPICGNCGKKGYYLCGINHCLSSRRNRS